MRNTAANRGFASGGVTCKLEDLCFYSRLSQVDSKVLRNARPLLIPPTDISH